MFACCSWQAAPAVAGGGCRDARAALGRVLLAAIVTRRVRPTLGSVGAGPPQAEAGETCRVAREARGVLVSLQFAMRQWQHTHVLPSAGQPLAVAGRGSRRAISTGTGRARLVPAAAHTCAARRRPGPAACGDRRERSQCMSGMGTCSERGLHMPGVCSGRRRQ